MHVTCCSLSTFAVVCFDDSVYFCYSIKSKTYSLIFQRDAYPLLPFLFLLFMFLSFILVLRVLPVVLLSDTVVRSDILRNPVNFSPFYWSSPLSPAAVARRYKFYNPSSRFRDQSFPQPHVNCLTLLHCCIFNSTRLLCIIIASHYTFISSFFLQIEVQCFSYLRGAFSPIGSLLLILVWRLQSLTIQLQRYKK